MSATCPHCDEPLPDSPDPWSILPPWQCTFCGGLFGYGEVDTYRIPATLEPVRYLMLWHQAKNWCQFTSENRPYCYAVCYPTGIPFYVGKGRALRMIQHGHFVREDLKSGGLPRDEKERVIKNLVDAQLFERYAVLAHCETDDEALALEHEAILQWGRRSKGDLLVNQDDGQGCGVLSWCLPSRPAIQADDTNLGIQWVSHPDVNPRILAHKGVVLACPCCNEQCMHPANVVLHGARCPNCCYFLAQDGEALHRYWMDNRPRVNETVSLVQLD